MDRNTRKTVLYVEDDENDAELMRLAFERSGLPGVLRVATSGADALEMLRGKTAEGSGESPCMLLLDINLPGMGGLEVLSQVRADPALDGLAVFILSSSSHHTDVEGARRRGATGYLTKPTSLAEFIDIVRLVNEQCAGLLG